MTKSVRRNALPRNELKGRNFIIAVSFIRYGSSQSVSIFAGLYIAVVRFTKFSKEPSNLSLGHRDETCSSG